jgi:hypothetical protein
MSARSVSGGATSSAARTRPVCAECAAQAPPAGSPGCARRRRGPVVGQQALVQPGQPVAATRPDPVGLLDPLETGQGFPAALPMGRAAVQPAGQGQDAQAVARCFGHSLILAALQRHCVRGQACHSPSLLMARKAPRACASTSIWRNARDVEVLRIDANLRKDNAERARLLNAADVAFLCLPDAAAREAAALVTNPRTCVIDASTAHRTGARLGLWPAGTGPRPARGHPREQAHFEPGLPCHGLHPAVAPLGRCRPGAGFAPSRRHPSPATRVAARR